MFTNEAQRRTIYYYFYRDYGFGRENSPLLLQSSFTFTLGATLSVLQDHSNEFVVNFEKFFVKEKKNLIQFYLRLISR